MSMPAPGRVTCTVTEVTTGGLEVTTSDGAPGFIRKAELARDRGDAGIA